MARKSKTNIDKAHFLYLLAHPQEFALVSCFHNGKPTVAISRVVKHRDSTYTIEPWFIGATGLTLTDHDGRDTEEHVDVQV